MLDKTAKISAFSILKMANNLVTAPHYMSTQAHTDTHSNGVNIVILRTDNIIFFK